MSENVQDYVTAYSLTRLEETAKTFRRLGEAYEDVARQKENGQGLSKQLFLVANVLEECMTMQVQEGNPKAGEIKELSRCAFFAGIRIRNIRHLNREGAASAVVMQARTVGRNCISARKLAQVLKRVYQCGYYSDDSNRSIINEEYHQYVFVQEDRFRLLSGVARINRGKDHYNGDNFFISHLECGKVIGAIADGMGSGRRACVESGMVIELMEHCLSAGFDEKAALELVNSAYIASHKEQNPVTMDMSVINCRLGYGHFIKLGAVATFIKREKWVEIITSTTLPMGVLEQTDYDTTTKKLYDGDYIVMVSDGILDNIAEVNKEEILAKIINGLTLKNPKAMAEKILKESLKHNHMKASDDCTVVVLGVFDTGNEF